MKSTLKVPSCFLLLLAFLWLRGALPTAPNSNVDITVVTGSAVSRLMLLRAVFRVNRAARLGTNRNSVKASVSTLLLFSLLSLSGDVELNPGPFRHLCRICDCPVKSI